MSYAILSLALFALFHFVYESILAPSFRMKLRFELRGLQDELRRLQRQGSLTAEQFRYLDESLSALISVLHRFDAATLVAVDQEMRRDPGLRRQVEARGRALDACGVPEVMALRRRIVHVATRAVIVNHGAWCVYVVPLAFAYFGLKNVTSLINVSTSLSRSDFFRITPNPQRRTEYSGQSGS